MKSVLLVYDVDGWAWHYMAAGIEKYADRGNFEVTAISQRDFNFLRRKFPWTLGHFHAICFFSWIDGPIPKDIFEGKQTTLMASQGFEFPYQLDPKTLPERIATRARNRDNAEKILPTFDTVLCVSQRIWRELPKAIKGAMIEHCVPGVDHHLFYYTPPHNREKLVVGWCGQKRGVTKGYEEVLRKVQSRLKDRIEWRVNIRGADSAFTQEEMVAWYGGLDIILSTSCSEGFQMPLVEAASCGRPAVATDVGGAGELIRDEASGFLVNGYVDEESAVKTVDQICDRIVQYDLNRELLLEHGLAARDSVDPNFSWQKRAKEWLTAMT